VVWFSGRRAAAVQELASPIDPISPISPISPIDRGMPVRRRSPTRPRRLADGWWAVDARLFITGNSPGSRAFRAKPLRAPDTREAADSSRAPRPDPLRRHGPADFMKLIGAENE
jgi:hypothetical protein